MSKIFHNLTLSLYRERQSELEPWMIFASLSEAAVFTGMRFCPSYQETMDCRLDHLRQIILTDDQQKKVVCCSENTIRRVSERLEQFDILVVVGNNLTIVRLKSIDIINWH